MVRRDSRPIFNNWCTTNCPRRETVCCSLSLSVTRTGTKWTELKCQRSNKPRDEIFDDYRPAHSSLVLQDSLSDSAVSETLLPAACPGLPILRLLPYWSDRGIRRFCVLRNVNGFSKVLIADLAFVFYNASSPDRHQHC